jgi:DNA polymerase-3 subunit alpha
MIGAAGSSIIFYLLGFSKVDPVRYRTFFQRFWNNKGEPPTVLFVAMPPDQRAWGDVPSPSRISVHPMTALEAVPELIRRRLSKAPVKESEKAVFEAIQRGETDGVFQLGSESIKPFLSELCPSTTKELATATALELISLSHPVEAAECLQGLVARRASSSPSPTTADDLVSKRPFVFQEDIMSVLHRQGGLPWRQTYRFIQAAAKSRMTDEHDLWKPTLERLHARYRENADAVFGKLIAASGWAPCRAHHAANSITSYRAAYYRTFHRREFEDALQEVPDWERGSDGGETDK